MYSRSFNQIHEIPPDYGGVALRNESEKPLAETAKHTTETYPRYPVYEDRDCGENNYQIPVHKDKCEEDIPQPRPQVNPPCPPDPPPPPAQKMHKGVGSEDILLAGLILLLMNEKNKDELLILILGFLLLMGNKL